MMACPASMAMTLPLTTDPSSGVSISKLSLRRASNSSMVALAHMRQSDPFCALTLQFMRAWAFDFTGRAVGSAGLGWRPPAADFASFRIPGKNKEGRKGPTLPDPHGPGFVHRVDDAPIIKARRLGKSGGRRPCARR